MGKNVRSARGVIVNFDLMKIKKQIAATPTPMEVKTRQNFIENRLKRRIKKAVDAEEVAREDVVAPELPKPAVAVNEALIEDDTTEPVLSEALAAVEAMDEEPVKEETKTIKQKSTKQVARPKKTTQESE